MSNSKIRIRERDGEYRVNYRIGREATAYYTTDKEDAIATGRAMLEAKEKKYEDVAKKIYFDDDGQGRTTVDRIVAILKEGFYDVCL